MNADQRRWGARPPRAQPTAPSRFVLGGVMLKRSAVVPLENAPSARARTTAGRAPALPMSASFYMRLWLLSPLPGEEGQGEGESTFSLTHFLTCARRHFWLPLLLQLNSPLNTRP